MLVQSVVRFVRGLARWIGGIFIPPSSMPSDQRIKIDYGARTKTDRRGLGWLVLTKDRLIFERAIMWLSFARLLPSPNFDVPVSDIRDVQKRPGDAFDRWPFVAMLSVTLRSGEQLCIQFIVVDDWIVQIEKFVADSDT